MGEPSSHRERKRAVLLRPWRRELALCRSRGRTLAEWSQAPARDELTAAARHYTDGPTRTDVEQVVSPRWDGGGRVGG